MDLHNNIKIKTIIYLLAAILVSSGLSCEYAREQYTLVNCSGRTITTYMPTSMPVSNKELFDRFKREDLSDTMPIILYKVAPDTLHYEFGLPSFEGQFRTKDKLMHMLIIDVDSVRAMCKKTSPDSSIIKSLVLEYFKYSKSQLEGRKRTIVYHEK